MELANILNQALFVFWRELVEIFLSMILPLHDWIARFSLAADSNSTSNIRKPHLMMFCPDFSIYINCCQVKDGSLFFWKRDPG